MEKHFQLDKQTVENFTLSQGSRKLYKLGGGGGGLCEEPSGMILKIWSLYRSSEMAFSESSLPLSLRPFIMICESMLSLSQDGLL